jgi:glycosyltransferase involved in cell wall biosynthesis
MKKYTVTVAIPAFNEEKNIAHIIRMVLKQKQINFTLSQLTVYDDKSTDRTVLIVKKLNKQYPLISLVEGQIQHGKMFLLNEIFKHARHDITIVLDADIGLVGDHFIEQLISPIIMNSTVNMVVANEAPLQAKTLIGKILRASFVLWDYVRLSVPNQDHVQNFYGAATAYRSSFAKTLQIPENLADERLYIFLMAKKTNSFRFLKNVKIVYWPITTIYDFVKISERSFGTKQQELEKIFGKDIETSCKIATKYKMIGIIKSLYYQPIYTPLALMVSYFLNKAAMRNTKRKSMLWEISTSTKKPILKVNL